MSLDHIDSKALSMKIEAYDVFRVSDMRLRGGYRLVTLIAAQQQSDIGRVE